MFILVFQQLLKMLILLIVGIVCTKIGLIKEEGGKTLSNLLLLVINPCMIIMSYQMDYDAALVRGLLLSFAAAVLTHFIGIIIATLGIKKGKSKDWAVERFCAIYSNCGFIGIPLINSVLGSEGVFYLTAYMAIFNIFVWTHGLIMFKGSFSPKNLKEGLLSPTMIATILAIILFFARIRFPAILADPLEYISDMNTPMAMLVAGFCVAGSDVKKVITNPRLYLVSALKLLLMPAATLLLLSVLPISETVAYTTLIASACPTAATASMMSLRYGQNNVYASEFYSFTTLFSIATIPLITFLASFVL